ncbi:MAG TPA: flagellar hook protein FlgE [Acetobacteraceae bacterium]|nr:flagellar hook protein FlgE [Acetobacteraceae bacterium]
MSLFTALSGLLAAQDGLDAISNNLANANTVGFKSGSALFSDLFSGASANAPGEGVTDQEIQQDFSQGTQESTGNPLDLEIQGNGFFVVQNQGQNSFTRDGAFHLSPSGQLQTASGKAVLGFGTNANGTSNGILSPIVVPNTNQTSQATSTVSLSAALNTADPVITSTFNEQNSKTFDESTSVTAFDSLGNANHVQLFFVQNKSSGSGSATTPGTWTVFAQPENANGSAIGSATNLTTLTFNSSGVLQSGGSATLNVNWNNGAAPSTIAFNFANTSLGAQSFAVGSSKSNGFGPGAFSSATISNTGQIQANFSNGQKVTVGNVALATFINNQGLIPESQNLFSSSENSGQPAFNIPGAGTSGTLVSGSLEQSNVQTSNELVQLLNFQQAYQANTSVLQGDQQDIQKLLQLN